MNCSLPGSSDPGIFQARILLWVAISDSRGSSWPRDWTWISCVSCTGRQILYYCTTWRWFQGTVFKDRMRGRVSGSLIISTTSFWLVVVRSSGANTINILIPVRMGFCDQHSINFFQVVRVLVSAKQLKDILQNIIYSSGGGTKGPWLCFMTKLFILSCLIVFLCFWIFSFLWLNLLFRTQENSGKAWEAKTFLQLIGDGYVDLSVPRRALQHPLLVLVLISSSLSSKGNLKLFPYL